MVPARKNRNVRILVMGVSGCGKSTLGQAVAQRLGLPFVEGDELHPARNVALMAAGTPLTDDDRQGWLQAVAARLAAARGIGAVVACSALKRSYRDQLRRAAPDLKVVYLSGSAALLSQRLQARAGHYMPLSLLPSQLQTLEPPAADEQALSLPITESTSTLVDLVLHHLESTAP
jgi:carbohydrate kinase (thermoresistant glucokinase family)